MSEKLKSGLSTHSVKLTIVAAIILTLSGKLGALLRDVFLAFSFGAGANIDAYFIANIIPGLLWAAIIATISAVILPIYVANKQSNQSEAGLVAIEAVRIYFLAGLVMAATVWLLAEPIVLFTASAASPETIELAIKLTRLMALGFIFTGYVGVQSVLQQANGRYLGPLTIPVVNHLITIGAILIGGYYQDITIAIAGAVLGWVVQAPIQRLRTLPFYSFTPGIRVRSASLKRIALLSLPISLGIFLDQANLYVGISISSKFGEGAVAHLSYASRLALFMANLVSWLVAYFLFPRIAACAARGDDRQSGQELGVGVVLIVGLTLPMLVVGLLFGQDLIRFVYGRGQFDAAAISATAAVFACYILGIIFMGLRELLNRVFFSYQRTSVPMVIGFIAAVINLAASLYLAPMFGVPGIALGAAIAAVTFVIMQYAVIFTWKPQLIDGRATRQVIALIAAATISACAGYLALPLLNELSSFTRLIAGSTLVGVLYVIIAAGMERFLGLGLWDQVKSLRDTSKIPGPVASPDPT